MRINLERTKALKRHNPAGSSADEFELPCPVFAAAVCTPVSALSTAIATTITVICDGFQKETANQRYIT